MNRLFSRALLTVGVSALLGAQGCSVYSALSQPPYIDLQTFRMGESRMRVSDVIGAAKVSRLEPPDNHVLDYHEFRSGTPGATRLRVVGYIIGDAFSFGAAELVFWPVELTLASARDFKAYFTYDDQLRVNGYRVVNDDGTVAIQAGMPPQSNGTTRP